MKKRIAIIGAGIGGTSILRRLVEHEKFNTEYSVDIYDKEALLAAGLRLNTTPNIYSSTRLLKKCR